MKAGVMVLTVPKGSHLDASWAFQLMWGSELAGWLVPQKLRDFQRAWRMTNRLSVSNGIYNGAPVLMGLLCGWING